MSRIESSAHCRAGRSGFTLVELLVVIAIIGVLGALLLPALSKAKGRARQAQCVSRIKQWAFAFIQYPDDHEGKIPREGAASDGEVQWNNWITVQKPQTADVWYNALSDYMTVPSAASYFYDRAAFYQPPSLFQCPGARMEPLSTIAMFSVAMNSQLIEPGDPSVQFTGTISWSRVLHPSDTPLFLDNLLEGERRVSPRQSSSNLGQPASMPSRFAGRRHGEGGNLSFADGSVRWYRGEEITDPANGQARNPSPVIWHVP